MRRIIIFELILLALMLSTTPIFAVNTASVLAGGVCINEVLPDPNSSTANTDTDGNGTADTLDEFVELYNFSAGDIDISGWQLWDSGFASGIWFTFPGNVDDGTTVLKAGAYAVILGAVQTGGSVPLMTNPDSLAFDAGMVAGVLTNAGDNVVLYDPGADEYIQLVYNNDAVDNPLVDYAGNGFSATAAQIGSVEDFGIGTDGKSLTRYPAGDANIVVHDAIPGIDATASPNSVTLSDVGGRGFTHLVINFLLISLLMAFLLFKRGHPGR